MAERFDESSRRRGGLMRTNVVLSTKLMLGVGVGVALLLLPAAVMAQGPFLPGPVEVVSTVPPNGDVNPYGVAFVPHGFPAGGALAAGDILVSNFNNSKNLQGTGTTIVQVPVAGGAPAVFFQGQGALGLSTALEVLLEGIVVVGNFPSTDGTCATATAGSLLVID